MDKIVITQNTIIQTFYDKNKVITYAIKGATFNLSIDMFKNPEKLVVGGFVRLNKHGKLKTTNSIKKRLFCVIELDNDFVVVRGC